jgi:hypothetical protein
VSGASKEKQEQGQPDSRGEAEAPTAEGGRPEVIGLRPAVTGVFVSIRCCSCREAFESYQPTVSGVPLGGHQCPRCHDVYEMRPEDFEAALDRFVPPRSFEEMVEITEEATRIAETWHQAAPLAELFFYKGVNLGEMTERYLLSYITLGLYGSGGSEGGPK